MKTVINRLQFAYKTSCRMARCSLFVRIGSIRLRQQRHAYPENLDLGRHRADDVSHEGTKARRHEEENKSHKPQETEYCCDCSIAADDGTLDSEVNKKRNSISAVFSKFFSFLGLTNPFNKKIREALWTFYTTSFSSCLRAFVPSCEIQKTLMPASRAVVVLAFCLPLNACSLVLPLHTKDPNDSLRADHDKLRSVYDHHPNNPNAANDLRALFDKGVKFRYTVFYISYAGYNRDLFGYYCRWFDPYCDYERFVAPVPVGELDHFLRNTKPDDLRKAFNQLIREPLYQTRVVLCSLAISNGPFPDGAEKYLRSDGTSKYSWREIEKLAEAKIKRQHLREKSKNKTLYPNL